jgi:hypothetical protein
VGIPAAAAATHTPWRDTAKSEGCLVPKKDDRKEAKGREPQKGVAFLPTGHKGRRRGTICGTRALMSSVFEFFKMIVLGFKKNLPKKSVNTCTCYVYLCEFSARETFYFGMLKKIQDSIKIL